MGPAKKKAKISRPLFCCSENLTKIFIIPRSLSVGMTIAENIVNHNEFYQIIRDLVENCSEDRSLLTKSQIDIDVITLDMSFGAYAVVYRQDKPYSMFFHPMIFVNAILNDDDAVLSQKWAYFFMVKIIHEYCHLINPIS